MKANNLCINCLRPGHFMKDCKSLHRCKVCQRPHHSLMHTESKGDHGSSGAGSDVTQTPPISFVVSHAASGLGRDVLLMTCTMLIKSPTGISIEARGILDSASSSSFVSECLAQFLKLPRSTCCVRISGIAGLSHY